MLIEDKTKGVIAKRMRIEFFFMLIEKNSMPIKKNFISIKFETYRHKIGHCKRQLQKIL